MNKVKNQGIISEGKVEEIVLLIIFCSVPIVTLIISMLIMNAMYHLMNFNSFYAEMFMIQTFPAILSLGVLPVLLYKKTSEKTIKKIVYPSARNKFFTALETLILVFFIVYLEKNWNSTIIIGPYILHFLVMAMLEEFLCRGIITEKLEGIFRIQWIAILVSAAVFAFVFHSSNGISDGVKYHMPFAIIMSAIYKKTGSLEIPILLHWFYNVILTMMEVM